MTDATPIFDLFRGSAATEILAVSVSQVPVFDQLSFAPLSFEDMASKLELENRPMSVLATGLRAMGLLQVTDRGLLEMTPLARQHLDPNSPYNISGYLKLAANSPGAVAFAERLKTNRPAGANNDAGAAFIYKEGTASAMEAEASARFLTLSLAGRARNVAPFLAERLASDEPRTILDLAGGSGLYAMALLQRNPKWRAIVLDRPEVLKTTKEFADAAGVSNRLTLHAGDMFTAELPQVDDVLLSNVLHDWDIAECRDLIEKSAAATPPGGRVLIHDVLLDDDLGGPLPVALYSATLFSLTEGRAYSAAEYRAWMEEAGLTVSPAVPTSVHCHILCGTKKL